MIGDLIRQEEDYPVHHRVGVLIPMSREDYGNTAAGVFFVTHPWGNPGMNTDAYWKIYDDQRTTHVIERPSA